MKKIVIVGTEGYRHVLQETAELSKRYTSVVFLDNAVLDGAEKPLSEVVSQIEDSEFVIAAEDNRIRYHLYTLLSACNVCFAILVHPSAIIGRDVRIGEGTVVLPRAVIGNDTVIGRGVILGSRSFVGDGCTVGDFTHVAAGARLCGGAVVDEKCLIGSGAVVDEGFSLSDDAVIEAGSVISREMMGKENGATGWQG